MFQNSIIKKNTVNNPVNTPQRLPQFIKSMPDSNNLLECFSPTKTKKILVKV